MRYKEQLLWDRVRRALRSHCELHRIENLLGAGMPDVLAQCGETCSVLIELKSVHKLPVRSSTRVFGDEGLNIDQRNWILSWTQAGGSALILGAAGKDLLWLVDGIHADAFNDMTAVELDAIALATNFDDVILILKGEK